MSENSTGKKSIFFLLFLLIVIGFLSSSLAYMILYYYSGDAFSKIVLVTAIAFLCLIAIIVVQVAGHRRIVSKSKIPICHDMVEEYRLCGRCVGFYVGLAFFGALLAIRSYAYVDLLRYIGVYPYSVLMFLILFSVPVHGALRRLRIVTSDSFLHAVGFAFGSSVYLIASWIIYLIYG